MKSQINRGAGTGTPSGLVPFNKRLALPATLPQSFLLLRQGQAHKLGQRAHGALGYQVLLDPERTTVYLRVVTNSGSGSFSDEPVGVQKLAQAVATRDQRSPLRGSVLQSAIVGKSVCNSGFMAAVLVAEGLLGRKQDKRFDLEDLGQWDAWTATQLSVQGELPVVRLDDVAKASEPKTGRGTEAASHEAAALAVKDEGGEEGGEQDALGNPPTVPQRVDPSEGGSTKPGRAKRSAAVVR